ncbi:MAG: hypothetical protein ACR2OD_12740, partial [Gaiellaceae bacterium]
MIFASAGVGAWLLWGTSVPQLELPDVAAEQLFEQDVLERGAEFRRGTRAFWAGATAVQLVVLALLAWRARWIVERIARADLRGRGRASLGPVSLAARMGAIAAIAVWVATLPLGAGRLAWRRRFDLTEQSYG